MLVDHIKLQIKAGSGGNGAVSFLRNGQKARGGPNGGNGGNGGSIYLQGNHNLSDLGQFRFKKKIKADDGKRGGRNNLFGKNAAHTTIFLPLGTQVIDENSNLIFEILDETSILIAKGGKGGRGNNEFKSSTNRSPAYAESGEIGEEKNLLLELKFIADVGLIGLPNAGKSSLLEVLTNAHPKIGNFPFTTVEPNVGMMPASPDGPLRQSTSEASGQGGENHMIADIPGLIEGAAEGRGLGIKFLKHIEKTKLLIHCIDATEKDFLKAYKTVRNEFEKYNTLLLEKPEIVLITKKDLVSETDLEKKMKNFEKLGLKVFTSSIYDETSLKNLTARIKSQIT